MLLKVFILCVVLVLNVECTKSGRQDAGTSKKESGFKSGRRSMRADVFENLFNVYDPSFLSGVWPKISNGVHLILEISCWDDMSVFFKDLTDGRAWAYDGEVSYERENKKRREAMARPKAKPTTRTSRPVASIINKTIDASGRYQAALFAGNRFWLGSKEECLRLDQSFQENNIDNETLALLRNNDYLNSVLRRQKYFDAETNDWRWMAQRDELLTRLAVADHRAPFRMAYTALHLQLNLTKITFTKSYEITLGVCLPQSCPKGDVESIINFSIMLNDNLKSNKTLPRITKVLSSRNIPDDFGIGTDAGAISLITITIILLTVSGIATLVDFDMLKCVRYKKQSMSFDLPTYNNSETKLVDELKQKHNTMKSVDDILAESKLDLVPMGKSARSLAASPPITLDVLNVQRISGSCHRCGKYKRQCLNNKHVENLAACPRVKYSSFASLSTDRKKENFFCRLLLCFSISYCWKRIFNKNTANKDLSLIHLMRILATLWIIFVHVTVLVGYNSDDVGDINERDSLYYTLATGTLAFDTLFFVSGLFSSHHFFYLKSRYSVEELVSFGGSCGQLMQFVCFVTNRVIRLVPSYAYAVLLSSVVARWSRSSSTLVVPDGDHLNCAAYWWRNLLYVTTVYPPQEQCMQISWYLTTETQLHALGALACAASKSASVRARLVAATATVLVLASAAVDVSAAYVEPGIHYADTYSMYGAVVERGWARVVPYFAGVLAGWLLHVLRARMNITKLTSSILWGASVPLLGASVSLPWAREAWLSAWMHLAWPIALLWPVIVCSTRYAGRFRGCLGGGSGGAALSRLSYSMLLVHGAVLKWLLAGDAALCSHAACLWMYFAGTAALSAAAALLLSVLIEMPCCGLFRRLSDCATT